MAVDKAGATSFIIQRDRNSTRMRSWRLPSILFKFSNVSQLRYEQKSEAEMFLRTVIAALSIVIGLATLVPAHAQLPHIQVRGEYTWFFWPDGRATGISTAIVLAAVAAGVLLLAWIIDQAKRSSPCSCNECVAKRARRAADRHDREAARLLAQSRQTEAHTELTARLIDKARVDAEFGEIKQITDHDRKIRSIHRSGR